MTAGSTSFTERLKLVVFDSDGFSPWLFEATGTLAFVEEFVSGPSSTSAVLCCTSIGSFESSADFL